QSNDHRQVGAAHRNLLAAGIARSQITGAASTDVAFGDILSGRGKPHLVRPIALHPRDARFRFGMDRAKSRVQSVSLRCGFGKFLSASLESAAPVICSLAPSRSL